MAAFHTRTEAVKTVAEGKQYDMYIVKCLGYFIQPLHTRAHKDTHHPSLQVPLGPLTPVWAGMRACVHPSCE